jgi:hypothetical protein
MAPDYQSTVAKRFTALQYSMGFTGRSYAVSGRPRHPFLRRLCLHRHARHGLNSQR